MHAPGFPFRASFKTPWRASYRSVFCCQRTKKMFTTIVPTIETRSMSPIGTNTVTLSDFHESVPGTRSTPSLARPSAPSPTIARTTATHEQNLARCLHETRLPRVSVVTRARPVWRRGDAVRHELLSKRRRGCNLACRGASHRVYRACPMELTREVRAPPRGYPARAGRWRTDDRRSPHRMMCGPRLVDVRLRRASSMAETRNPSLLRYAVADANDSLLTRVAIFSTSRSASFS